MADLSQPQPAGRRRYDDQGAAVVPLREYLEQQIEAGQTELAGKITASHSELAGEISALRTEMANAQATATKEHAAVQAKLTELGTAVEKLNAVELRDEGAAKFRATVWKASAAIIGSMAALCAIAGFVISQS